MDRLACCRRAVAVAVSLRCRLAVLVRVRVRCLTLCRIDPRHRAPPPARARCPDRMEVARLVRVLTRNGRLKVVVVLNEMKREI
jgi:hypothetical protein